MTKRILLNEVISNLRGDPQLNCISVSVKDGLVILTGHVPDVAARKTAQKLLRKIKGVSTIATAVSVTGISSDPAANP